MNAAGTDPPLHDPMPTNPYARPRSRRSLTVQLVLLGACFAALTVLLVSLGGIWFETQWEPGSTGPVNDPHGYARFGSVVFGVPAAAGWFVLAIALRRTWRRRRNA